MARRKGERRKEEEEKRAKIMTPSFEGGRVPLQANGWTWELCPAIIEYEVEFDPFSPGASPGRLVTPIRSRG